MMRQSTPTTTAAMPISSTSEKWNEAVAKLGAGLDVTLAGRVIRKYGTIRLRMADNVAARNRLASAAAAVTVALADGLDPPGADYLTVREVLMQMLGSERDRSDADELVDAVLDRFAGRARAGAVEPALAGAYLMRSFVNARIDRHRAHARHPSVELQESHSASEDDAIFRLIEADAARQEIYAALQDAFRQRDATVVKVVLEWIRASEQSHGKPTLAEVGAAVGVSPQAVADALERFRERYVSVARLAKS
jgi:hypothetical protein